MPNHVTNVLTIVGDKDIVAKMHEAVKNDKYGLGTIDFNKVVPIPDNIYRGDLGIIERRKYGKNNWYDWNVNNWEQNGMPMDMTEPITAHIHLALLDFSLLGQLHT